MTNRKILVSLPEETIKSLDLYRFLYGTSRTENIRELIHSRLNENKTKIDTQAQSILSLNTKRNGKDN